MKAKKPKVVKVKAKAKKEKPRVKPFRFGECKPCECGTNNIFMGEDFLRTYFEVGCFECNRLVKAATETEAIAAWNGEKK